MFELLMQTAMPLPKRLWAHIPMNINPSNSMLSHLSKGIRSQVVHLSGFQTAVLQDVEWIPRAVEEAIFKHALLLTQQTDLGLQLGRKTHTAYYGMLGYLMLVCPDLQTALKCACEHPMQLGAYFRVRVLSDAQWVYLELDSFQGDESDESLRAFHVDLCLSALACIVQNLLGQDCLPSAMSLKRSQPEHFTQYQLILGCVPSFEQNRDFICFPKSWLRKTTLFGSQMAFDLALKHCQQIEQELLMQSENPEIFKINQLLHSDLAHFVLEKNVAHALHMTERTMRRYLKSLNTSFQMLLDQNRLELACRYLKEPNIHIYQIAEKLAYSDTNAFRVAFKRWTGLTPSAFRRKPADLS